jgi:uncharacterized metal-binding protein
MSDSTGLIAISFLGIVGIWVNLYIGRQANEMGLQIYSGVVDGTTVPTVQRWQMLYTMWVPYQAFGFGAASFLLVANLLMASLVGNENVKLLAYLAVVMAVAGCLSWSLTGLVIFSNYRSVLRQVEAD